MDMRWERAAPGHFERDLRGAVHMRDSLPVSVMLMERVNDGRGR